jgi:hypothetical protein
MCATGATTVQIILLNKGRLSLACFRHGVSLPARFGHRMCFISHITGRNHGTAFKGCTSLSTLINKENAKKISAILGPAHRTSLLCPLNGVRLKWQTQSPDMSIIIATIALIVFNTP